MPIRVDITADDELFLGADQPIVCTIMQSDGETPEDVSGLTALQFVVAVGKGDESLPSGNPADGLIVKTFGAGIALNTDGQDGKVLISLVKTDTDGVSALSKKLKQSSETTFWYSVKRFDPDEILTWGTIVFLASTQRHA